MTMRWITLIIQPFKLDAVRHALATIGVQGLTVTEIYRGLEYKIDLLPRLELGIAVRGDQVEDAVEAIVTAAVTGKVGGGLTIVCKLDHALRIHTLDSDEDAL
jgi:nitrogen regulatory protein P-II 2